MGCEEKEGEDDFLERCWLGMPQTPGAWVQGGGLGGVEGLRKDGFLCGPLGFEVEPLSWDGEWWLVSSVTGLD